MQSKVTVAICAYNAAAYIEQTLRGVLRQTFKEFELLIINDCSTDNTLEVVESTLLDFRHRVINLTHNQGIAYARERALEESRTRYVIFIDADDIPLSGLLEQEYRVISSDDNIIGVSSWYRFIDTDGRAMRGGLFTGPKSREAFELMARGEKLIFLPIYTMFDREAALRVGGFRLDGFPCGRPRHQDYCEDL
ncbi:MAG: glycosyltransferase family 2 protein, partial [Rikenellaceae bacterium]